MKKKLCALLALAMLLCLLPALAMAADGYVRVMRGNEPAVLTTDYDYSGEPSEVLNILKSGLTIVGADGSGGGVYHVKQLNVYENIEVTLKDVQIIEEKMCW